MYFYIYTSTNWVFVEKGRCADYIADNEERVNKLKEFQSKWP